MADKFAYRLVIKSQSEPDVCISQLNLKKEGLKLATVAAEAAKDEGFQVVGADGKYFVVGFGAEYWLVLEKTEEPEEVDWEMGQFLTELGPEQGAEPSQGA